MLVARDAKAENVDLAPELEFAVYVPAEYSLKWWATTLLALYFSNIMSEMSVYGPG